MKITISKVKNMLELEITAAQTMQKKTSEIEDIAIEIIEEKVKNKKHNKAF